MVKNKVRVADYIAETLSSLGVKYVYGIMGGGASGLNDGFIKNENIQYICTHHEQGAGYAACGEAKVTRKLAVVNPTTGCGGANCITPLLDAWQDSLPVLFISGNVKVDQCSSIINQRNSCNIRKYGVQESDIISTVKSLCKYSKLVDKSYDIELALKEAIQSCLSPRMGPSWIDIPSDIQHSLIDSPQAFELDIHKPNSKNTFDLEKLKQAKRPLVLAGYGIYLSGQEKQFKSFIEAFNLPFVTSYLGIDLIPYEHKLNLGSIGIKGSRAGNFSIQNCDYLLILGCSLNCSHTGYDENLFSPNSYKVQVDIDNNEYKKNKININQFHNMDLGDFFQNVI
jgi:acetolactate synthase-1/2/3 large subunit